MSMCESVISKQESEASGYDDVISNSYKPLARIESFATGLSPRYVIVSLCRYKGAAFRPKDNVHIHVNLPEMFITRCQKAVRGTLSVVGEYVYINLNEPYNTFVMTARSVTLRGHVCAPEVIQGTAKYATMDWSFSNNIIKIRLPPPLLKKNASQLITPDLVIPSQKTKVREVPPIIVNRPSLVKKVFGVDPDPFCTFLMKSPNINARHIDPKDELLRKDRMSLTDLISFIRKYSGEFARIANRHTIMIGNNPFTYRAAMEFANRIRMDLELPVITEIVA